MANNKGSFFDGASGSPSGGGAVAPTPSGGTATDKVVVSGIVDSATEELLLTRSDSEVITIDLAKVFDVHALARVSGLTWQPSTQILTINQAGGTSRSVKITGFVLDGDEGVEALTELTDVNITSPANNEALVYDSATGVWSNKEILVGGVSAGVGITIDADDEISVTNPFTEADETRLDDANITSLIAADNPVFTDSDTTYTGGTGIDIDASNEITTDSTIATTSELALATKYLTATETHSVRLKEIYSDDDNDICFVDEQVVLGQNYLDPDFEFPVAIFQVNSSDEDSLYVTMTGDVSTEDYILAQIFPAHEITFIGDGFTMTLNADATFTRIGPVQFGVSDTRFRYPSSDFTIVGTPDNVLYTFTGTGIGFKAGDIQVTLKDDQKAPSLESLPTHIGDALTAGSGISIDGTEISANTVIYDHYTNMFAQEVSFTYRTGNVAVTNEFVFLTNGDLFLRYADGNAPTADVLGAMTIGSLFRVKKAGSNEFDPQVGIFEITGAIDHQPTDFDIQIPYAHFDVPGSFDVLANLNNGDTGLRLEVRLSTGGIGDYDGTHAGLVPQPTSTEQALANAYLDVDGNWTAPTGGGSLADDSVGVDELDDIKDGLNYYLRDGTANWVLVGREVTGTAANTGGGLITIDALASFINSGQFILLTDQPTGAGNSAGTPYVNGDAWTVIQQIRLRSGDGSIGFTATSTAIYIIDPANLNNWAVFEVSNDEFNFGNTISSYNVVSLIASSGVIPDRGTEIRMEADNLVSGLTGFTLTTEAAADGSITEAKLDIDTAGTDGQVLTRTATGMDWETPSAGSGINYYAGVANGPLPGIINKNYDNTDLPLPYSFEASAVVPTNENDITLINGTNTHTLVVRNTSLSSVGSGSSVNLVHVRVGASDCVYQVISISRGDTYLEMILDKSTINNFSDILDAGIGDNTGINVTWSATESLQPASVHNYYTNIFPGVTNFAFTTSALIAANQFGVVANGNLDIAYNSADAPPTDVTAILVLGAVIRVTKAGSGGFNTQAGLYELTAAYVPNEGNSIQIPFTFLPVAGSTDVISAASNGDTGFKFEVVLSEGGIGEYDGTHTGLVPQPTSTEKATVGAVLGVDGNWASALEADLFIKNNAFTATLGYTSGRLTSILYEDNDSSLVLGSYYKTLFYNASTGRLSSIRLFSGTSEITDNLIYTKVLVYTDGILTSITPTLA